MKCFGINSDITHCDDFDIRYIEYGCNEQEHVHDGIEMIYITEGCGEHIIDGQAIKVERGSLIVAGYNTVHSIQTWKTMQYYNILFKASFLNTLQDRNANLKDLFKQLYNYDCLNSFLYVNFKDEELMQKVEEIFFEILKEAMKRDLQYEGFCRCYIDEIFNIALRERQDKYSMSQSDIIDDVIQYISDNSSKPLALDDVAKKFGYNSRYLSDKIKKHFGMSFKQFLIERRLNSAVEELLKSDESIEQIAEKCGFTNKSYFYELFTKTYGINPKFIKEYSRDYEKSLELRIKQTK